MGEGAGFGVRVVELLRAYGNQNRILALFVDPKLARKPVTDVAHAWLESNPGKRDGSWQRDEIVIRRHVVPAIGADAIGGVTPADVQALVNRWGRSLAPRTVRRQYGVVRAIFQLCREQRHDRQDAVPRHQSSRGHLGTCPAGGC